jgi:ABC-2 type transport system permease protein
MNRRSLVALRSLTVASIKMYFRNRAAIFFTLFLPLAFIGVFGLLSKGSGTKFTVGLTNQSSIMQLGIFSVAFAFVSMKTSGMLRRIQATPAHPGQFVFAQAATRLIIGVLQVILLTVLGIWLFDFHMLGNIGEFLLVAIFGVLVFLAFGFIVAGVAKDENQAAPIANLVAFPMMFLSGTFFDRANFPGAVQHITDFFPLTYLADALRKIANEGAHITQLGGDMIGLTVWGIVLFIIAIRVFRWE